MLVVKLGGSAGADFGPLVEDVASRSSRGEKLVLVHGGSTTADELAQALGCPPRHFTSPSGVSSRYTDRATMEILMMACAGRLNKLLVESLQRHGVNAVGLTGLDGRLLSGIRKKAVRAIEDGRTFVIHDDYSGSIREVNAGFLNLLLSKGYTPVLSSLALSENGEALNVDADRVAAAVATALGAEVLVFLTNVPGLLKDPADWGSVIDRICPDELPAYQNIARGRMKKKLLAAAEAMAGGVSRVVIGAARRATPLSLALAGWGTVIAP